MNDLIIQWKTPKILFCLELHKQNTTDHFKTKQILKMYFFFKMLQNLTDAKQYDITHPPQLKREGSAAGYVRALWRSVRLRVHFTLREAFVPHSVMDQWPSGIHSLHH